MLFFFLVEEKRYVLFFFFSSRRRHTRYIGDWSSDVCSSDLACILANGPQTQQERWENQGGWSPATIASEIAGLVTAADIARRNRDPQSAKAWEAKADEWRAVVDAWTYTTSGPYGAGSYYLRLTKDANPNAGTAYNIGDSGPNDVDQRK